MLPAPPEACGTRTRILQVHPTRRCNLECLHCYSSSGPGERDELSLSLLAGALDDASGEGYTVAGFSGGEPLLYRPLAELLRHAKGAGLVTTVTSNGTLFTRDRLALLQGALDLLAISLDGEPASHIRMRADTRAFSRLKDGLRVVRESGIPFGFIFTLTQYNLHELAWVADFAAEQGAALLQVHPLERVGRAIRRLPDEQPDSNEAAHAYLECVRIQEAHRARLLVQLDFFDREALSAESAPIVAGRSQGPQVPFSAVVSPLVIEPDGWVVPIRFGFDRALALGCLHERRLSELIHLWRDRSLAAFQARCRRVFSEISTPTDLPFFNWYERIGFSDQTSSP